ncbi:hypothetical protein HAX54_015371 [Datura stramonium]|uniref:Uncharacterized protein n=1 Tax=Datura stramonium TaxID=4076 RepID=A0ABS8S001_DATST|nr:hypothetical protein [Datura stramonium]
MSGAGTLRGTPSGSQFRDEARTSVQAVVQGVQSSRAQPTTTAPHLEILLVPVVAQPIAASQFINLVPSRFSRTPGENAYEFLVSFQDRLWIMCRLSGGYVARPIEAATRGLAARVVSVVLSPEGGCSGQSGQLSQSSGQTSRGLYLAIRVVVVNLAQRDLLISRSQTGGATSVVSWGISLESVPDLCIVGNRVSWFRPLGL